MSPNGLVVNSNEPSDPSVKKTTKDAEEGFPYTKEYSYEESLDLIGFGKVQLEVLFVSGMLLMGLINETMGISIILIASKCDFNTNSQEQAIISAASFVGIFVASYPFGYMSDTRGRRIVIIWATIFAIIFSFISMWVSNLWGFVALRFLTGIGLAGASSAVYSYLSEFNTMKYRPVVINYASMFVGLAAIYYPAVAWLMLPQTWTFSVFGIYTFRPWRLLILFNLLPGLIGTIWLFRLPETPKLYISHGKNKEALTVFNWMYEQNTGKSSSEFQVKRLQPADNKEFMETLDLKRTTGETIVYIWKQTVPLFKAPLVLSFLVCCFVMIGLFFISSGMGLWYPEIQNRLGFGANGVQMTICEVVGEKSNNTQSTDDICSDKINTKMYVDSLTLGGAFIAAYIVLGIVIGPLGRKAVLCGTLFLSGCCGLALQWIDQPIAVVVLFCGFLVLPGLAISVLSGSVVEFIPTHLSGKAVCICLCLGRFGSVIGSNIIGAILENSCSVTFYLFIGYAALCALLTLSLPI